jgi:hypothetical protein
VNAPAKGIEKKSQIQKAQEERAPQQQDHAVCCWRESGGVGFDGRGEEGGDWRCLPLLASLQVPQ